MDGRISKSIEKMQFIIDDLSMANPNKFSESLGFDNPEIIYKILRGKTSIDKNLAMLINEKHPQYSIDWILTGNVEFKNNAIMINLDDTIFNDPKRMNALVRFLSKHHMQFMEDELFQLYYDRIRNDVLEDENLRKARELALKKDNRFN
ncbi:MAG: hypothetical protein GY931_14145 [Maribacter sp.]|nr:hypothetical protein [Maribacter sp.]